MDDSPGVKYTIGGCVVEVRVTERREAMTFTYSIRFQGVDGEFLPWMPSGESFATEGAAYAAALQFASKA